MTLRDLMSEHPEWADLMIVVQKPDGSYDYVGDGAGTVFEGEDDGKKVLVFAED